jgi:Uma2 family endonuclease
MTTLTKSRRLYTEAEYLALERDSEERHEYLDGVIYAVGESPYDDIIYTDLTVVSQYHGSICTNLTVEIGSQLRGRPCQVFAKDMKVLSDSVPKSRYPTTGLDSCPDLVVVCGDPQFHDEFRDVLLNPRVIIEVLSPSTEAFDRGEKFLRYRTHLESLTDYVVVAQIRPLVEHFARQPNGQWVIAATATDLSESVVLNSIGCTLRLSDIYDRIVFPEETAEPPNPE